MTRLYTTDGREVTVYFTSGVPVWQVDGETVEPAPTPTVDTSRMTVRRQVTDLVGGNRTSVYGDTEGRTYLTTYTVRADATGLSVGVADMETGRVMDVAVAVYHDGTLYPATIGGQALAQTTGVGQNTTREGQVQTDPIPVTVQAGDTLDVLIYHGASTTGHPRVQSTKMYAVASVAMNDQTRAGVDGMSGPDFVTSALSTPPRAHTITGLTYPETVAVAIDGDSISESGSPDDGKGTFLTRAVHEAGLPWGNYGVWANQASPTIDGRTPHLSIFTHVLCEYGFNDLNNAVIQPASRPLDGYVKQRLIQHWQWMTAEGPQVYQTTISPQSTSTDGWTTVEGQTPAQSAEWKRQLNDWIRDGAPIIDGAPAPIGDPAAMRAGQDGHPLAGWLEVAHTVESSPNSTIFRVDHGPLAADGAHPNGVGHELMSAPIRQWAQQITTL